MKNHLNQFKTSYRYKFIFEDCIHFPIDKNGVKHILVLDNKRRYDFLDENEIQTWKEYFGEVNGEL